MKEAWATQVLIPFGIVRADACCFNTDLQGRQSRIFGYGERACELIEPSPYMPYHKMLRDELGKGVDRIKRIHPWERDERSLEDARRGFGITYSELSPLL